MSLGDRIKWDYVSLRSTNVSEDEAAVESFMQQNPDKVSVLRTATTGGSNFSRVRSERREVTDDGKVKLQIPFFIGTERYRKRDLKSDEEIRQEKMLADREARNAERRRCRAERLAAEQSNES